MKAAIRSLDIVAAMNHPGLFQPWFPGESWNGWRAVLKGAFALPMSDAELSFFREVAERDPPRRPVREAWFIAGRLSGKDSVTSLIIAHAAAFFDRQHLLRPGERALCIALACDRDRAKILLNYSRSYFAEIAPLEAMITHETDSGFKLNNGVDVVVGTSNFRSFGSRRILCAVFNDPAFWRNQAGRATDEDLYNTIIPAMATVPDAILIGISLPFRKTGLLYKKYCDHFGRDGDILVVRAPSRALNPTLDQVIIAKAIENDPSLARAEWFAEFRASAGTFVNPDIPAHYASGRFKTYNVETWLSLGDGFVRHRTGKMMTEKEFWTAFPNARKIKLDVFGDKDR